MSLAFQEIGPSCSAVRGKIRSNGAYRFGRAVSAIVNAVLPDINICLLEISAPPVWLALSGSTRSRGYVVK
jgi:hypothetical protein